MQDNTAGTANLSGNILIDGLVGGTRWLQTHLTYAFPTNFSQYGAAYAAQYGVGFTQYSAAFQANAEYWMQQVENATLLTFSAGAPETATLRWGRFDDPYNGAYAFLPQSFDSGGDMWFANNENEPGVAGDAMMHVILHELLHALGLKHPHEGSINLPTEFDVNTYTSVSYNTHAGPSDPNRFSREFTDWEQSLPLLDIQALQYLYGANFSYNSGSTTYQFDSTNGSLIIDGVNQGSVAGSRIFRSIWDGGGHDLYDLSNFSEDQTISLEPGEWSTFSRGQLAANSLLRAQNGGLTRNDEPGNIVNALL